jgi:UDP-N-acetyl-D-mannosaminuronic acid dehydrogenase
MDIYHELLNQGNYEVCAFDPHVKADFVCKNLSEALYESDLMLVLTNHNEFKVLDNELIKNMNHQIIFDTVNIVDSSCLDEEIEYYNYGNLFEFEQRKQLVEK